MILFDQMIFRDGRPAFYGCRESSAVLSAWNLSGHGRTQWWEPDATVAGTAARDWEVCSHIILDLENHALETVHPDWLPDRRNQWMDDLRHTYWMIYRKFCPGSFVLQYNQPSMETRTGKRFSDGYVVARYRGDLESLDSWLEEMQGRVDRLPPGPVYLLTGPCIRGSGRLMPYRDWEEAIAEMIRWPLSGIVFWYRPPLALRQVTLSDARSHIDAIQMANVQLLRGQGWWAA